MKPGDLVACCSQTAVFAASVGHFQGQGKIGEMKQGDLAMVVVSGVKHESYEIIESLIVTSELLLCWVIESQLIVMT